MIDLAPLLDHEIAKPWHEWRSPTLLRLYARRNPEARIAKAFVTLSLLLGFYMSTMALDLFFIPDVELRALGCRFVVAPFIVGCCLLRLRRCKNLEEVQWCHAVCVIVAASMWCFLLLSSRMHAGAMDYLNSAFLFFVGNIFCGLSFGVAVCSSAFLLAIISGTVAKIGGPTSVFFFSHFVNLVWAIILTLIVNWRTNAEKYTAFIRNLKSEMQQRLIEERSNELLLLSATDGLTGLPNRRTVDHALATLCTDAVATERPFAVLLIDIDFFKRFNDTYGHQAGDRCLATVAQAMKASLTEHESFIGRFGGEEFVALLRCQTVEAAADAAARVGKSVAALGIAHDKRDDDLRTVTISIGLAFSADVEIATPESLIKLADQGLYEAKADGRNCVRQHAGRYASAIRDVASGGAVDLEGLRAALSEMRRADSCSGAPIARQA